MGVSLNRVAPICYVSAVSSFCYIGKHLKKQGIVRLPLARGNKSRRKPKRRGSASAAFR